MKIRVFRKSHQSGSGYKPLTYIISNVQKQLAAFELLICVRTMLGAALVRRDTYTPCTHTAAHSILDIFSSENIIII